MIYLRYLSVVFQHKRRVETVIDRPPETHSKRRRNSNPKEQTLSPFIFGSETEGLHTLRLHPLPEEPNFLDHGVLVPKGVETSHLFLCVTTRKVGEPTVLTLGPWGSLSVHETGYIRGPSINRRNNGLVSSHLLLGLMSRKRQMSRSHVGHGPHPFGVPGVWRVTELSSSSHVTF